MGGKLTETVSAIKLFFHATNYLFSQWINLLIIFLINLYIWKIMKNVTVQLSVILDGKQICTFEKLQPVNFWLICYNELLPIIKIVADQFLFVQSQIIDHR